MDKRRYRGVTPRGNWWQISFTLPSGERCREIVRAPQTRKGLEYAYARRCEILMAIDRGVFDYGTYFPRSPRATRYSRVAGDHILVKDALVEFLREADRRCAPSTSRDYAARVYKHLFPSFGDLRLSELRADHFREWVLAQELSGKSINNTLIPLRRVFRRAFQEEKIPRDPLSLVPWSPVRSREADPFSRKEVEAIVDQLDRVASQVANYFRFAFETGLRTSEMIALQWQDVDVSGARVFVRRAKVRGLVKPPKTAAGRRSVQLTDSAMLALGRQETIGVDDGEVFRDPRTGDPWTNDQALRKVYWYPALDALGLRRRNPYQTRHTFASLALSNGANPLYVASQMGHKDWGMIRNVYGRWCQ